MTGRGRKRVALAVMTAAVIGGFTWLAVVAGGGEPANTVAADVAASPEGDEPVADVAAELAAARAEARQRLPARPVVLPPRAPRTDTLPEPRPRSDF